MGPAQFNNTTPLISSQSLQSPTSAGLPVLKEASTLERLCSFALTTVPHIKSAEATFAQVLPVDGDAIPGIVNQPSQEVEQVSAFQQQQALSQHITKIFGRLDVNQVESALEFPVALQIRKEILYLYYLLNSRYNCCDLKKRNLVIVFNNI